MFGNSVPTLPCLCACNNGMGKNRILLYSCVDYDWLMACHARVNGFDLFASARQWTPLRQWQK